MSVKTRVVMAAFFAFSVICLSASLRAEEAPVIEAEMSFAPAVPPPIRRDHEARVVVRLESTEFRGELTRGTEYDFWGYNGRVPGPFIRVREGDTLEFHLANDETSENTHTVDFHAVTGTGGGAKALMTEPGGEAVLLAKALNPGLYIYHCAAPPIPVHIANGLYGLLLVEPKEGLPPADREYYVMQSEFYTEEPIGTKGLVTFSSKKGMDEDATYVVFNGRVGSLTGDGALAAEPGETVRLYIGNIGPNLVSSFHVIGEIFDSVYREGTLSDPDHNIQSTLIPAGSASTVEFKIDAPGDYTLVDHSIFRINKGAVGILHVEGEEKPEIFKKVQ